MDNNEILSDNRFIYRAKKLYYDLQTSDTYEIDEEERVEVDYHVIGNLFKKKISYEKKRVPLINKYNRDAKALSIKPLIFSNMWEFCQFVKWAEKIVFYKNTTDNTIYVDSAIDDLDCRLLVYNNKDFNIRFKLEKVLNPSYIPNTLSDVLSMNKNDTPKYFKSMKIIVERTYGKNMTNHFTIIDDNTDFEDMSDTLLFETIESILREEFAILIKQVFELIYYTYKVEE